jgi:hypothetical protein
MKHHQIKVNKTPKAQSGDKTTTISRKFLRSREFLRRKNKKQSKWTTTKSQGNDNVQGQQHIQLQQTKRNVKRQKTK